MPELKSMVFAELQGAAIYCNPVSPLRSPDHSELDITLLVACYNEQENIVASLDAVVAAMGELDFSWEMIVIDDASTDTSALLIKRFMSEHPDCPICLVVRDENRGLAQNFIDAAFLGKGEYYRIINGDNVESSRQIASILRHVGEADMVLPYHAEIQGRSQFRRWLSRAFTAVVNLLSGYRIKYYNGCGVHRRYNVLRWHVNCSGFDFQANLVTRLLEQGKTYVEIPVVGGERAFGQSKALTLKNFLSAFRFFMDLAFRRTWRACHGKKQSIHRQVN